MNTRQVATEYRLTQWAQIMQTRKNRGQSISAFCASEGISRNTYFYWQRKLREAACSGLARQAPVNTELVPRAIHEPVPSGWTRLETAPRAESIPSLTIEVGGCRISVGSGVDSELLAKVCRALKHL